MISQSSSNTDSSRFSSGMVVEVMPRLWPGINKPGGVARVNLVRYMEDEDVYAYDVVYIVNNGKEMQVDEKYIKILEEESGPRRTKGRCKFCGSFIRDCGHNQSGPDPTVSTASIVVSQEAEASSHMKAPKRKRKRKKLSHIDKSERLFTKIYVNYDDSIVSKVVNSNQIEDTLIDILDDDKSDENEDEISLEGTSSELKAQRYINYHSNTSMQGNESKPLTEGTLSILEDVIGLNPKEEARRIHRMLYDNCLHESEGIEFINNNVADEYHNKEFKDAISELKNSSGEVILEVLRLAHNFVQNLRIRAETVGTDRATLIEECENAQSHLSSVDNDDYKLQLANKIVALDNAQETIFLQIERAGFEVFNRCEDYIKSRLKFMANKRAIRQDIDTMSLRVNSVANEWRDELKSARKDMELIGRLFEDAFGYCVEDVVDGLDEEEEEASDSGYSSESSEAPSIAMDESEMLTVPSKPRIRDAALEAANSRRNKGYFVFSQDSDAVERIRPTKTKFKNFHQSTNAIIDKRKVSTAETKPTSSRLMQAVDKLRQSATLSDTKSASDFSTNLSSKRTNNHNKTNEKLSLPILMKSLDGTYMSNQNKLVPLNSAKRDALTRALKTEVHPPTNSIKRKDNSSDTKIETRPFSRGSLYSFTLPPKNSSRYDGRIVILENNDLMSDLNNLNMPITVSSYHLSNEPIDQLLYTSAYSSRKLRAASEEEAIELDEGGKPMITNSLLRHDEEDDDLAGDRVDVFPDQRRSKSLFPAIDDALDLNSSPPSDADILRFLENSWVATTEISRWVSCQSESERAELFNEFFAVLIKILKRDLLLSLLNLDSIASLSNDIADNRRNHPLESSLLSDWKVARKELSRQVAFVCSLLFGQTLPAFIRSRLGNLILESSPVIKQLHLQSILAASIEIERLLSSFSLAKGKGMSKSIARAAAYSNECPSFPLLCLSARKVHDAASIIPHSVLYYHVHKVNWVASQFESNLSDPSVSIAGLLIECGSYCYDILSEIASAMLRDAHLSLEIGSRLLHFLKRDEFGTLHKMLISGDTFSKLISLILVCSSTLDLCCNQFAKRWQGKGLLDSKANQMMSKLELKMWERLDFALGNAVHPETHSKTIGVGIIYQVNAVELIGATKSKSKENSSESEPPPPPRGEPIISSESIWATINTLTSILQLMIKKRDNVCTRVVNNWSEVKVLLSMAADQLVATSSSQESVIEKEKGFLRGLQRMVAMCLRWDNSMEAHEIFISTLKKIEPYFKRLRVTTAADSDKEADEIWSLLRPSDLSLPAWEPKSSLVMNALVYFSSYSAHSYRDMDPWQSFRMSLHHQLLLAVSMVYQSFSLQNPLRRHLNRFFDYYKPSNMNKDFGDQSLVADGNIEMDFIDAIRSQYKLLLQNCCDESHMTAAGAAAGGPASNILLRRMKFQLSSQIKKVVELFSQSPCFVSGNLLCLLVKELSGLFGSEVVRADWGLLKSITDLVVALPLGGPSGEDIPGYEADQQRSCLMYMVSLFVFNPFPVMTSCGNAAAKQQEPNEARPGNFASTAELDCIRSVQQEWISQDRDLLTLKPLLQLVDLVLILYRSRVQLDTSSSGGAIAGVAGISGGAGSATIAPNTTHQQQLVYSVLSSCTSILVYLKRSYKSEISTCFELESSFDSIPLSAIRLYKIPLELFNASLNLCDSLFTIQAALASQSKRLGTFIGASYIFPYALVTSLSSTIIQYSILPLLSLLQGGEYSQLQQKTSTYIHDIISGVSSTLLKLVKIYHNKARDSFLTLARACKETSETFCLDPMESDLSLLTYRDGDVSPSIVAKAMEDRSFVSKLTSSVPVSILCKEVFPSLVFLLFVKKYVFPVIDSGAEKSMREETFAAASEFQQLHFQPESLLQSINHCFDRATSDAKDSLLPFWLRLVFWQEFVQLVYSVFICSEKVPFSKRIYQHFLQSIAKEIFGGSSGGSLFQQIITACLVVDVNLSAKFKATQGINHRTMCSRLCDLRRLYFVDNNSLATSVLVAPNQTIQSLFYSNVCNVFISSGDGAEMLLCIIQQVIKEVHAANSNASTAVIVQPRVLQMTSPVIDVIQRSMKFLRLCRFHGSSSSSCIPRIDSCYAALKKSFCYLLASTVQGVGGLIFLSDITHMTSFFTEFVYAEVKAALFEKNNSKKYLELLPLYITVVAQAPFSTRVTEWEVLLEPLLQSCKGSTVEKEEIIMQWCVSLYTPLVNIRDVIPVETASQTPLMKSCWKRAVQAAYDWRMNMQQAQISLDTQVNKEGHRSFVEYLLTRQCAAWTRAHHSLESLLGIQSSTVTSSALIDDAKTSLKTGLSVFSSLAS